MKINKILAYIFASLFIHGVAFATTYTVKTSGGDYSNPITCINSVSAGDVCEMYDGTYSGGTMTGSGSAGGGYISLYPAAGQTSVVITGNITPSSSGGEHIIFGGDVSFTINGQIRTESITSSGPEWDYIKFQNFILNNPVENDLYGIWIEGDYGLIDSITFTNWSHDLIHVHGDYWVIRNCVGTDMTPYGSVHMDFAQFHCNDTGLDVATHVLVEGNTFANVPGGDTHFLMGNDTGTGHCGLPFEYYIVRYNVVNHIGSQGVFFDTNTIASGQHDLHSYNNTFVELWYGAEDHSYVHHAEGMDYSSGINNIFYNSLLLSDAEGWLVPTNWYSDYQLFYSSNGSLTLDSPADGEANSVSDEDPLFNNAAGGDFTLQNGSPAINAGGPLTQANGSGSSSTTLIVDNAAVFCDGWGGWVTADYIAIGTVENTVQISSINYSTDTITLASAMTWSDDASIWLYKDSDGDVVLYGSAPDIGAYEYQSGETSATATMGGTGGGKFGGSGSTVMQ